MHASLTVEPWLSDVRIFPFFIDVILVTSSGGEAGLPDPAEEAPLLGVDAFFFFPLPATSLYRAKGLAVLSLSSACVAVIRSKRLLKAVDA